MRDAVQIHSIVRRAAGLSVAVAALLAASGCGNGLAEVTGAVTVDGQPLSGGNGVRVTVTFQPASGPGRVAVGLVDENGNYRLSSGSQSGVVPGEYVVTCSATQIMRNQDGAVTGGRRLTDPSYANSKTSGLKFTVSPGNNQIDLALNSHTAAGAGSRTP